MTGSLDTSGVLDARKFEITIRKLADSLGYGADRSPYLGSGTEYVQSRPYQARRPGAVHRLANHRALRKAVREGVRDAQADAVLPAGGHVGVDDHFLDHAE